MLDDRIGLTLFSIGLCAALLYIHSRIIESKRLTAACLIVLSLLFFSSAGACLSVAISIAFDLRSGSLIAFAVLAVMASFALFGISRVLGLCKR